MGFCFNFFYFLILKFIDKYKTIYKLNKQGTDVRKLKIKETKKNTSVIQDVAIINSVQKKEVVR